MKIQSQFVVTAGLLLSSSGAFAAAACISGKSQYNNLIQQMTQAKATSPITTVISVQYQLNQTQADCVECSSAKTFLSDSVKKVVAAIEGVPDSPKLLFNPLCLRGSSDDFHAGVAQVSCPSGQRSRTTTLCQTEEIMTYQNAVISSLMTCAKKAGLPTISPSVLFGIYSVESGFKPQYASRNGLGMGQLTGIFVKDVLQKWRGGEYMQKIAQSNLPECAAAKFLAAKDLRSPPRHSNSCAFTQLGEGMERNVLYTMVGLATAWEKDLSPKLNAYLQKHAGHPALEEIKSLTIANAYGAGGRADARALASRLTALSPDAYLNAIKKPMTATKNRRHIRVLNNYTLKIATREKKIAADLPEPLKSNYTKQGAKACLNP